MKKVLFSTFFLCSVLVSCDKEANKNALVVRDCTGTYLQIDGKDYQVCNLEKVNSFPAGTPVAASFEKLDECNGSAKDAVVCLMLHPSEGWIEVTDIQQ
jgi:hypothetical protein